MNKKYTFWVLYATCIPVRGYKKSIIYDFYNACYHNIPNSLCDLLLNYECKLNLPEISKTLDIEENHIFEQFVDYLELNDFGFYTNEPDSFLPIEQKIVYPSKITNAVLYVSEVNLLNLRKIIDQLDALGCKALELRFEKGSELSFIQNVVAKFDDSLLTAIELIVNKHDGLAFGFEQLSALSDQFDRIKRITIYGSTLSEQRIYKDKLIVDYISMPYSSDKCGTVSHKSLIFSMEFYCEAKVANSCLNKKVVIAQNGDIKNCIASNVVIGNIEQMDIENLLFDNTYNIQKKITKDSIEVCRDCEFRYACMDCRSSGSVTGIFAPQKCSYNPYIGAWYDQVDYLPISETGSFDKDCRYVLNPQYQ